MASGVYERSVIKLKQTSSDKIASIGNTIKNFGFLNKLIFFLCNRRHFGTLHRSKLHQLVRNSILDCEILERESGAEERKSKKVARKINCCIFLPPPLFLLKNELAFFQVV